MTDIHLSLKPETVFTIGNFPVTNSFWVAVAVSILLMIVFVAMARRMKEVPGPIQLFIETYVVGSYDFVHGVTRNEVATKRIFPLFATMAIFFLVSNMIGFLPIITALSTQDGVPIYRAATTDYSLIFAITMAMFFIWQMIAIVTGGLVGYVKKFFNFSSPVAFAMGLLDIIGEVAKIVSLSFRLFGNIFAGEVIATVLLALVPFVAPVPFYLLGMLSAVIQAFVFPILVLIFMTMAVAVKEERERDASATAGASS